MWHAHSEVNATRGTPVEILYAWTQTKKNKKGEFDFNECNSLTMVIHFLRRHYPEKASTQIIFGESILQGSCSLTNGILS